LVGLVAAPSEAPYLTASIVAPWLDLSATVAELALCQEPAPSVLRHTRGALLESLASMPAFGELLRAERDQLVDALVDLGPAPSPHLSGARPPAVLEWARQVYRRLNDAHKAGATNEELTHVWTQCTTAAPVAVGDDAAWLVPDPGQAHQACLDSRAAIGRLLVELDTEMHRAQVGAEPKTLGALYPYGVPSYAQGLTEQQAVPDLIQPR
jgi:hypothetical protein